METNCKICSRVLTEEIATCEISDCPHRDKEEDKLFWEYLPGKTIAKAAYNESDFVIEFTDGTKMEISGFMVIIHCEEMKP